VNNATNNVGYGLIGAYVLVYTGLAVSIICPKNPKSFLTV
jgi:hydrogenase maturation factor